MKKEKKEKIGFGGKTENFESKKERLFEQKHLKEYLKGSIVFTYGKDKAGNKIRHTVKRRIIE